jgi:hypothetical protein
MNAEGVIGEPDRLRNTGNKPRPAGDYEIEWARCTEQAKHLWVQVNKAKLEIGRLACEVCQIQWGGGNHWSGFERVKTLMDFSRETGIAYKSLHRYASIYRRIFCNLPPGVWDDRNWNAAQRTYRKLESAGIRDPEPQNVTEIYIKEKTRKGSASKSLMVIRNLLNSRNHLASINWNFVDESEKQRIGELLIECCDRYPSDETDEPDETQSEPVNP